MSEDLFVCNCGRRSYYYCSPQCGKCYNKHCLECHVKLKTQYGVDEFHCLAKCDNCTDDESEGESEEESEENPFVCKCGGCIEPEKEEKSEKQQEISNYKGCTIWKVDYTNTENGDYTEKLFVDKKDAISLYLEIIQKWASDPDNYDYKGELEESDISLSNHTLN